MKRIDRLLRKRKPKLSDPHFKSRLRVREIERPIWHRWSGIIPDTDDAEHTIRLVAQHLRHYARTSLAGLLIDWCRRWAPHMPEDKLRGIAWQVQRWPRLYKADTLARLQLLFAERATLKITTIGAIDMDQEKRKLRRAKQHQAKMEKRRRILGAKPRAEYEANALSNTKPWEQEIPPISRRTWERHRKASVASLCPAVASADAASFLSIAASAPATAVSLPPAWLLTSPAWTKPRDTPYGPVSPLALWLAFWMQAQKSRSHSATTTVASPAAA